ncbi:hypothetical protein [Actinomadura litoris]|uniref:hypothetical protein n=1 Tax=Actinomadura litoris TaxID=2678616 RepID=UPI001FA79F2F|nr:hypothetical protein [Actinomadura litoris]
MPDSLEQELHNLSSCEEHIALRWVLDHHPDVFASAARAVRRIRALDERGVRKEARS